MENEDLQALSEELDGLSERMDSIEGKVDDIDLEAIAQSIEDKIMQRDQREREEMAATHKASLEAIKEEIKNILHGTQ